MPLDTRHLPVTETWNDVMPDSPHPSGEYPNGVFRHFAGIHVLRFGWLMSKAGCFRISFIPSFERSGPGWKADALPLLGGDDPADAQQARLLTAANADFAVTPDAERAGSLEGFRHDDEDEDSTVLSYVSPTAFAAELDANAKAERRGDTFLSDLAHLDCIRHLQTVVFPSAPFRSSFGGYVLRNYGA